MGLRGILVVAGLATGSVLVAGRAVSQEGGGPAPPAPAEVKKEFRGADYREYSEAERMARMTVASTPNRFHERLGRHVGDWEFDMTMWMEPGKPPMVTRGTSRISWLFEGKWVKEDVKSSMMGMPFEGVSILGYDNFKKKYVGVWVGNMGTAFTTFEGNYGMDDRVLQMFGTMDEPMTGESDKPAKFVVREVSADEFVFEIHDLEIGESNTKVIEMKYKRKK